MLVDFRNDLMKNFHVDLIYEPKKKPNISKKHNKTSFILTKPLNSMNFKPNWTLFFPFDDNYCVFENITINTRENIVKKRGFSSNFPDFLWKYRNREKCEKKRENQKVIAFKEAKSLYKEENREAIAIKDSFDLDVGVESIFKVLTKHIKVYFYIQQFLVKYNFLLRF